VVAQEHFVYSLVVAVAGPLRGMRVEVRGALDGLDDLSIQAESGERASFAERVALLADLTVTESVWDKLSGRERRIPLTLKGRSAHVGRRRIELAVAPIDAPGAGCVCPFELETFERELPLAEDRGLAPRGARWHDVEIHRHGIAIGGAVIAYEGDAIARCVRQLDRDPNDGLAVALIPRPDLDYGTFWRAGRAFTSALDGASMTITAPTFRMERRAVEFIGDETMRAARVVVGGESLTDAARERIRRDRVASAVIAARDDVTVDRVLEAAHMLREVRYFAVADDDLSLYFALLREAARPS
jgi:hypothetical protein